MLLHPLPPQEIDAVFQADFVNIRPCFHRLRGPWLLPHEALPVGDVEARISDRRVAGEWVHVRPQPPFVAPLVVARVVETATFPGGMEVLICVGQNSVEHFFFAELGEPLDDV